MNTVTMPVQHLEITLEENAVMSDIKKALMMIKGIASVRVERPKKATITPALASKISKARKEYQNGETISCSTPEEMQHYFDSL